MPKTDDNVNHKGRTPSAANAADELLELMHTVTHQVRSRQFQALRDGPEALTPLESKVLGFFARRPGATQSDLAEHSGRDKAQLARLIKGLRERGLLEGKADAADRRQLRLHLSARCQPLLRALQQHGRTVGAQAVAGLSAAECEQLRALLQRLHANLGGAEG